MTDSKSNWGDWTGSQLSGPMWTPYAQAIADCYPNQIPWFYSIPSNLVGGVGPLGDSIYITNPQLHDVLILGAWAIDRSSFGFDELEFLFINISHEETGIPWVVPTSLPYIPVPVIAGVAEPVSFPGFFRPANSQRLPEAFFLPAHNRLRVSWFGQPSPGFPADADALLTLIGVRLTGAPAPSHVPMPDGSIIPVGSRLPWFVSIPLGTRLWNTGTDDIILNNRSQFVQYTQEQQCVVEVHGAYYNALNAGNNERNFIFLRQSHIPTRAWTPQWAQIRAVAGDSSKIDHSMPYAMPIILRRGDRLQFDEALFNPVGFGSFGLMLSLSGVRLCEY